MSTVMTQDASASTAPEAVRPREITVFGHSGLFYWWPVWVIGYLFALLTYLQGMDTPFRDMVVKVHPNPSLGVIFTAVFLVVMILTHMAIRGLASLTVIIAALAVTFLFAYLDWWDDVFRAIGNLAIFMNLGFYVFFSTAVFIAWLLALFAYDRVEYWSFRPGQMVYHTLFSTGEQSFDTHGMTVDKMRDDLFRHWVLGMGSGDLIVSTVGAKKADFVIRNVLFVGSKLQRIQELVAMKPDQAAQTVLTAGAPE